MATIIPRWEWRTFGTRFAHAETVFAGLEPQDVRESTEIYLLTETEGNVKIRDELLDIKVLQKANAAGLEQWMPVMKAGFPLSAANVAKAFKAMGIPMPPLSRDAYTLEQFFAELVGCNPAVRAVKVHKRRVRYTVNGCMAELSEVTVEGKGTRTIAVEMEDPEAVMAAVRFLGLTDYVNTHYPRGLAAVAGGDLPRYAVIDVGTNSVKFHLAEVAVDGTWRAVEDRAELTRLGEGLKEGGAISEAAMERTATAIAGMAETARRNRCVAIAAVGTAGLRMAGNARDVIDTIRSRTGIAIEILSGEEEGRLAYLAVRAGLRMGEGTMVVFDTGGGSSQFTFGRGDRVIERFSVNVGAVRYTERFGLDGVVSPQVLTEAYAAISADLSRIDGRPKPDALVAMGGAVTNLAAVGCAMAKYDPDLIQGTTLHQLEIERQIELYRSRAVTARREIVGLQPKRADVILAGACIVRVIMEKLGKDSLTVSDRGLRHGLLIDRFGR
jgi:exopolyphosphatase/guanosine-5'-triphosphate,3'-diphosphate pyrophosphatase